MHTSGLEATRTEGTLTTSSDLPIEHHRSRISIAILALGGQGGGVLAQWVTRLGEDGGYRAQATSVPGVAQRTGATIYYVEMAKWQPANEPILSLTPVPDDVDVVLASELMEVGRAILRGFVSRDLTTLIGSTHRIYAISEKSARGDGLAPPRVVLEAAARRAKRFIGFDMAAAAQQTGSAISAVMFGALAGSEALPFPREAFVKAIMSGDKSTRVNLAGFEAGYEGSRNRQRADTPPDARTPAATTSAGRQLEERIAAELPPISHSMAIEGVRRLMDYQDAAYANFYLNRLAQVHRLDDGRNDWVLTRETARYLALWMAYDDTIRVADLKVRKERTARVRNELRVQDTQIVSITEFMHPRFREVCDTLPRSVGDRLHRSPIANRLLARIFNQGRFIETTGLAGFVMLSLIASLRRWRRSTLRYAEEQARIEAWLEVVCNAAATDLDAAVELIRCQRLIKGYGETFERGIESFDRAIATYRQLTGSPNAAAVLRKLREATLASTSH